MPTLFGLCEGPIDSILRFWSGGNQNAVSTVFPNPYKVDPPLLFYTVFSGTGTQNTWQWFADVASLGGGLYAAVAAQGFPYRFLAYIASPCADWGNDLRPPQQSFEVVRKPVPSAAKADSYGFGAVDYAPDEIIFDFLTNPTYGMGLQLSDFDAASFDQYMRYCRSCGMHLSPLLPESP